MMSDCKKCWDTPCTCGFEYLTWLPKRVAEQAQMLAALARFMVEQPEYLSLSPDDLYQKFKIWQENQVPLDSDPDCSYTEWVLTAYELKLKLGAEGYDIFDSWSSKGEKYVSSEETKRVWDKIIV